MGQVAIRPATAADTGDIRQMLRQHGLPLEGLEPHLESALVAADGSKVVGCAALEMYDRAALLRSVAVESGRKGEGIGRALTAAALAMARTRGASRVYLLTTTAEGFFPRFGFERVDRDQVPDDVRRSVEFVSACPASAAVMRVELDWPRR
jgi:amino-acid N-acetyltransferase